MIKNRNLIKKLLVALIEENGGSINLRTLEGFLDDGVNSHELYPSFPNQEVNWNLEDDAKMRFQGFIDMVKKMENSGDMINITFSPRCQGCDGDLKKHKVEEGIFTFRCNNCCVDFRFKILHESEPIAVTIDEEEASHF